MKFVLETKKSKKEIINILKENTHEDIPMSKNVWDDNVFKNFFRGTISDSSFYIQQCTRTQIANVPLVYGSITESLDCTLVHITLKRYKIVNALLAFWFSGVGLLLILISITSPKFFFIPLGMVIFGILIHIVPYEHFSKKARIKLEELLK